MAVAKLFFWGKNITHNVTAEISGTPKAVTFGLEFTLSKVLDRNFYLSKSRIGL
jgi:hypothetical protein